MSLVLCATCSRHVRASSLACPFCGGDALAPSGPPEIMPLGATRAQIFLGALTLAAATSVVACNKSDTPTNEPTKGIVQPYGAPIPTVDAAPPSSPDAGPLRPPSPTGAYGAPPKPG